MNRASQAQRSVAQVARPRNELQSARPSSSPLDCLGRGRREGQAARGRFASLDTAAPARGMAAIEEDGGESGHGEISAGGTAVRRAISVPLAPVTRGLSQSLADVPHRRSGRTTARTVQIPKLIVRTREKDGQHAGERCKSSGWTQIRGWAAECTCPPLQPQA
jgi:hypothetical protein